MRVCGRTSFQRARPFVAVLFLQLGLAGMDVLSKSIMNKGMNNYVLVVYRHAVATLVMTPFAIFLDRRVRPKMTLKIFIKIVVLGLLEPVIFLNFYLLGMRYTTATFAAAMYNIQPALTFVLACIFRLERVKLRSIWSMAKVVGAVATVAGAVIMTLVKGPALHFFWTSGTSTAQQEALEAIEIQRVIRGSVFIIIGCLSDASYMILQAYTLRTYQTELSLAAWICLVGTIEGTAVALVMERGHSGVWAIGWDTRLLTVVCTGIVCSGLGFYIGGIVIKDRGPVFLTAFNPLCMVLVAGMSSFIFTEQMYLGRVLGAVVICIGLYLVIWGKSKEHPSQSTDANLETDSNTIATVGGKENVAQIEQEET